MASPQTVVGRADGKISIAPKIVLINTSIQLRKVTKSKRVFPSDMSLFKLLYLVQQNLKNDWEGPMFRWRQTYAQMMILFEERMTQP